MVNSGSFESEGQDADRNEKAGCTQPQQQLNANSDDSSTHSSCPVTASAALQCKPGLSHTADSSDGLPSAIGAPQAIEPTPTQTKFNNMPIENNVTTSDDNNISSSSVVGCDAPLSSAPSISNAAPSSLFSDDQNNSLCCSLPLDKVQGVLNPFQPPSAVADEDPAIRAKPTRKLLCLYCDRSFASANLRQKHVERIHSVKQNRRVSSRRQYQLTVTPCIYCDKLNSTENTLKDLFQHLVNEHSNKYFGCLPCEDRFLNSSLLADHNASNHQCVATRTVENKISTTSTNDKNLTSPTQIPLKDEENTEIIESQDEDVPIKVTRSQVKSRMEESRSAKIRNKKLTVKSSRIAFKKRESKRLQAITKAEESQKKKRSKPADKKFVNTTKSEQTNNSTKTTEKTKSSTTCINPYPEFDNFYRVKKITDHSIDNLKISSLTFDDVFDKAFFNRIKCNIEENLLHHIDGKLFKNEESENRISNFEKVSTSPQETQNTNPEHYGCELSLNAVTPVASLSLNSQYGEDFESQIEYGSKPSKKKTQIKTDEVHYKYFTRRKYQASILEHKENRDLSKLDMWTQLVIKKRQQKMLDDKKSAKEMMEYTTGNEYRSKIKREELNRILDRRGPFEDLKEEASKKAALDKLDGASDDSISHESFTEVQEVLNEILDRVFSETEFPPHRSPADMEEILSASNKNIVDNRQIPSYLNLRRASTLPIEGDIDRSDKIALICSSQETENYELPTNRVRNKNELIELSGEWARCRMYICAACGAKLPNIKYLLDHKSLCHQNVWVQHYEFVGNQSELYRHLSIPVLGKVGKVEETVPCKIWKRSEARVCTKCGKQCNSLGELHRHVLECGGDWTWMLVRKKCKYRPYGTKSRRKRRGLVSRIYHKQKTEPTEKKKYKKSFEGPRQRPSDAETIQRMLANLPAKRSTRKLISLQDGEQRTNKSNQIRNQKKVKCGKVIYTSSNIKENAEKTINSSRIKVTSNSQNNISTRKRALRSFTKVLSSKILDTNAKLNVKRKLKVINDRRRTRQQIARNRIDISDEVDSKESDIKSSTKPIDNVPIPKRSSPRSIANKMKKMSVKNILTGKINIKSFFPVKKKKNRNNGTNNIESNTAKILNSELNETSLKSKRRSQEPDEVGESNDDQQPKIQAKKTKTDTLSNLVRSLSIKKRNTIKNIEQESEITLVKNDEPIQKDKEENNDQKKTVKKRKLRQNFKNMLNRVKKLKIDSSTQCEETSDTPINQDNMQKLPTRSNEIAFLGNTNQSDISAVPNEKIIIPSTLEAKENLADISETALIAANLTETKENPLIPENIFQLESKNEEQLQAKGELNFDKEPIIMPPKANSNVMIETTQVILSTDITKPMEKINPITVETTSLSKTKTTPLTSPNMKGKIKKPTRGLNDCIAMLTSKLQQQKSTECHTKPLHQVLPPVTGTNKPITDPIPHKSECILKIPTFKTNLVVPLEEALDLTTKKKVDQHEPLNEFPVRTSVYLTPLSIQNAALETVHRTINNVLDTKLIANDILKWPNGVKNTIDDTIQKVIDNYQEPNNLPALPSATLKRNSVDDIIDFVVTNNLTNINDHYLPIEMQQTLLTCSKQKPPTKTHNRKIGSVRNLKPKEMIQLQQNDEGSLSKSVEIVFEKNAAMEVNCKLNLINIDKKNESSKSSQAIPELTPKINIQDKIIETLLGMRCENMTLLSEDLKDIPQPNSPNKTKVDLNAGFLEVSEDLKVPKKHSQPKKIGEIREIIAKDKSHVVRGDVLETNLDNLLNSEEINTNPGVSTSTISIQDSQATTQNENQIKLSNEDEPHVMESKTLPIPDSSTVCDSDEDVPLSTLIQNDKNSEESKKRTDNLLCTSEDDKSKADHAVEPKLSSPVIGDCASPVNKEDVVTNIEEKIIKNGETKNGELENEVVMLRNLDSDVTDVSENVERIDIPPSGNDVLKEQTNNLTDVISSYKDVAVVDKIPNTTELDENSKKSQSKEASKVTRKNVSNKTKKRSRRSIKSITEANVFDVPNGTEVNIALSEEAADVNEMQGTNQIIDNTAAIEKASSTVATNDYQLGEAKIIISEPESNNKVDTQNCNKNNIQPPKRPAKTNLRLLRKSKSATDLLQKRQTGKITNTEHDPQNQSEEIPRKLTRSRSLRNTNIINLESSHCEKTSPEKTIIHTPDKDMDIDNSSFESDCNNSRNLIEEPTNVELSPQDSSLLIPSNPVTECNNVDSNIEKTCQVNEPNAKTITTMEISTASPVVSKIDSDCVNNIPNNDNDNLKSPDNSDQSIDGKDFSIVNMESSESSKTQKLTLKINKIELQPTEINREIENHHSDNNTDHIKAALKVKSKFLRRKKLFTKKRSDVKQSIEEKILIKSTLPLCNIDNHDSKVVSSPVNNYQLSSLSSVQEPQYTEHVAEIANVEPMLMIPATKDEDLVVSSPQNGRTCPEAEFKSGTSGSLENTEDEIKEINESDCSVLETDKKKQNIRTRNRKSEKRQRRNVLNVTSVNNGKILLDNSPNIDLLVSNVTDDITISEAQTEVCNENISIEKTDCSTSSVEDSLIYNRISNKEEEYMAVISDSVSFDDSNTEMTIIDNDKIGNRVTRSSKSDSPLNQKKSIGRVSKNLPKRKSFKNRKTDALPQAIEEGMENGDVPCKSKLDAKLEAVTFYENITGINQTFDLVEENTIEDQVSVNIALTPTKTSKSARRNGNKKTKISLNEVFTQKNMTQVELYPTRTLRNRSTNSTNGSREVESIEITKRLEIENRDNTTSKSKLRKSKEKTNDPFHDTSKNVDISDDTAPDSTSVKSIADISDEKFVDKELTNSNRCDDNLQDKTNLEEICHVENKPIVESLSSDKVVDNIHEAVESETQLITHIRSLRSTRSKNNDIKNHVQKHTSKLDKEIAIPSNDAGLEDPVRQNSTKLRKTEVMKNISDQNEETGQSLFLTEKSLEISSISFDSEKDKSNNENNDSTFDQVNKDFNEIIQDLCKGDSDETKSDQRKIIDEIDFESKSLNVNGLISSKFNKLGTVTDLADISESKLRVLPFRKSKSQKNIHQGTNKDCDELIKSQDHHIKSAGTKNYRKTKSSNDITQKDIVPPLNLNEKHDSAGTLECIDSDNSTSVTDKESDLNLVRPRSARNRPVVNYAEDDENVSIRNDVNYKHEIKLDDEKSESSLRKSRTSNKKKSNKQGRDVNTEIEIDHQFTAPSRNHSVALEITQSNNSVSNLEILDSVVSDAKPNDETNIEAEESKSEEFPIKIIINKNKTRRKSKSFRKIDHKGRNDLFEDFALVIKKPKGTAPIITFSPADTFSKNTDSNDLTTSVETLQQEPTIIDLNDESVEEMDMELDEIPITTNIIERNDVNITLPEQRITSEDTQDFVEILTAHKEPHRKKKKGKLGQSKVISPQSPEPTVLSVEEESHTDKAGESIENEILNIVDLPSSQNTEVTSNPEHLISDMDKITRNDVLNKKRLKKKSKKTNKVSHKKPEKVLDSSEKFDLDNHNSHGFSQSESLLAVNKEKDIDRIYTFSDSEDIDEPLEIPKRLPRIKTKSLSDNMEKETFRNKVSDVVLTNDNEETLSGYNIYKKIATEHNPSSKETLIDAVSELHDDKMTEELPSMQETESIDVIKKSKKKLKETSEDKDMSIRNNVTNIGLSFKKKVKNNQPALNQDEIQNKSSLEDVCENFGLTRKPRTAKAKALEHIHDDAIADLTDNEKAQSRKTNVDLHTKAPDTMKRTKKLKKQKQPDVIETIEDKTPLLANLVADLAGLEELENSIERELNAEKEFCHMVVDLDDKKDETNELNEEAIQITDFEMNKTQELRRSRRSKKIASYNENDLLEPLIDVGDGNKKNRKKESAVENNENKKNINTDELFDLLKASTSEIPVFTPNPPVFSLTNFDDSSRDNNNENFGELFENILEKSSLLIQTNIKRQKEEENRIYEFSDEAEVSNKENEIDSQMDLDTKAKATKYNSENVSSSDQSVSSSNSTIELTSQEKETDTKTKENKSKESSYCEICNKSFIRLDNLIKHKRTLTHIQKLSEIEAKLAKEKTIIVDENSKETSNISSGTLQVSSLESNESDININNILSKSDKAYSNSTPTVHSFGKNNSLKLADIINDVLNKPVLHDDNFEQSCVSPAPTENEANITHHEFKRCKSLGERKSFNSDKNVNSSQTNESLFSKTTILEKQICLLENIIENQSNVNYVDDISMSSNGSERNSISGVISKSDDSLKPRNIEDSFLKPTQYEEISEDSANLRNYEDQKMRKTLNRDEELFLECCSLLKSGSEVSSYSNKKSQTKNNSSTLPIGPVTEQDWLNQNDGGGKGRYDIIDDYSDHNSRIPTPLGDSYDDDASDSNTISSNWDMKNQITNDSQQKKPDIMSTTFNLDEVLKHELETNKISSIEDRKKKCQWNVNEGKEEIADIPQKDIKTIITKGARKVFEGLKVSIPTEELNMDEVLNNSPKTRKKESEIIQSHLDQDKPSVMASPQTVKISRSARKSKPVKKSQVGSNLLFKVKKNRVVSPGRAKTIVDQELDDKINSYDVYDFEETQDNSDIFTKPDFRAFRNLKTGEAMDPESDTESRDYLDPCSIERESLTSTSVSSLSSLKKAKNEVTKKKCMIMGRIFKNAAKSKIEDIDEEIRSIPVIDNEELVENYVANCKRVIKNEAKPKLTEKEINQLFDQLLENKNSENDDNNTTTKSTKSKTDSKKAVDTKKRTKVKNKKRARTNSASTDDEFKLHNTTKRIHRKNAKAEDNCINLEQELKECIGVASRKSQRKCTSGKQNVLVEYWSSDESQFEALLESQRIHGISNISIAAKTKEKTLPPPENSNEKELANVNFELIEKVIKPKKVSHKKKIAPEKKKKTTTVETSKLSDTTCNRRKRAAVNPLYHWSSSSEDESQDLIEVKPVRDEIEDDEDRPVQHGWIVGDSPKKLVTMLAQAKGKKTDIDGVKEQGKKRTNNNAVS